MAKKKSASGTKKRASGGGATRKKSSKKAARKAAVKKPAAKKKPTAKKAAVKKKSAKKSPAKKKTAAPKKAATKTAAVKKKAPASKKTTPKVAASAKKKTAASVSKKKVASAAASRSRSKPKAKTPEPRPEQSLKDARKAAASLAAAAGLRPVQKLASNGEAEVKQRRKLTKSPLSAAELERFRALLLEKRTEVAGDVSTMESEALGGKSGSLSSLPQHMADQGSDEYEQSLSLDLAASQRKLLVEIDAALERIEGGVYGICESMSAPIRKARLEATPWARFSLEGAQQLDKFGRQH